MSGDPAQPLRRRRRGEGSTGRGNRLHTRKRKHEHPSETATESPFFDSSKNRQHSGKRLHTRKHKHENPSDTAAESPFGSSGKHSGPIIKLSFDHYVMITANFQTKNLQFWNLSQTNSQTQKSSQTNLVLFFV